MNLYSHEKQGMKFIVQGILFKFALDIHKIYGGDEYSQKAAGHDLKVTN